MAVWREVQDVTAGAAATAVAFPGAGESEGGIRSLYVPRALGRRACLRWREGRGGL